ncbi:MAG: M23 family metallopeptidase [Patescibacteria group bacterium]
MGTQEPIKAPFTNGKSRHSHYRTALSSFARAVSPFLVAFSLLLEPATAVASFFSVVSGFFEKETPLHRGPAVSSQTMPLLEAVANPDPKASHIIDLSIVDKSALLAVSGPLGTDADIETASPSRDQISVYVVREGDTLQVIAKLFGVSVNTIIWANNLEKGAATPGQTLVILPVSGITYTVKKGDTLDSIAKRLKGDAEEIADFNGIPRTHTLAVGDEIVVPDGEKEAPAPKAKPKAKTRLGVALPDSAYFAWPVPAGVRTQGIHGHNGVDIGASTGSSVVASAGGTVIVARGDGGWNGGYGNYVVVSHANGMQTLYSHLSSVSVVVGKVVGKGAKLGAVGSTGHSTGPHLHFEVRGGKNPFGY